MNNPIMVFAGGAKAVPVLSQKTYRTEAYRFQGGVYSEVPMESLSTHGWIFHLEGSVIVECCFKRNKSTRNFKVNNIPKALRALFLVKGYSFES